MDKEVTIKKSKKELCCSVCTHLKETNVMQTDKSPGSSKEMGAAAIRSPKCMWLVARETAAATDRRDEN